MTGDGLHQLADEARIRGRGILYQKLRAVASIHDILRLQVSLAARNRIRQKRDLLLDVTPFPFHPTSRKSGAGGIEAPCDEGLHRRLQTQFD